MALKDKIPDIMTHIRDHEEHLQMNLRIFRVFEGELKCEIEASLQREILSPQAYKRAKERIPSVNIIKKATDKLSKVYANTPVRHTDQEQDQEIMDDLVKTGAVNKAFHNSNEMYNAVFMSALEPFLQDGVVKTRVLGGHQFLPYSDDPINPLKMTVFIKLMGTDLKIVGPKLDREGRRISNTVETDVRQVNLYMLYSDEEVMMVDSDGDVRLDKMREMGIKSTKNPFGRIPATYISKSSFELIPYPNIEGLDISILIPKLLTDLNYAAQFMSHSIIWVKNANGLEGAEINPDALVNLGETEPGGGDPEMGTVDPTVQIEHTLQLIEFEMAGYFSSIGIKTATVGSMMPGREASGIAKAMDEGDTMAERKVQAELYKNIEQDYWSLMKDMLTVWVDSGSLKGQRKFSESFLDTFNIIYTSLKPVESQLDKNNRLQFELENGLTSKRRAIKELHPGLSTKEIEAIIKEADKEKQELMDQMMENDFNAGAPADKDDSDRQ